MDSRLIYYCVVVVINTLELRILYRRTKAFQRAKLTADYIVTSIGLADLITGINGVIIYSLYAAKYNVPMLGRRIGFQFSLAASALNVWLLTGDRLFMVTAPFRHRIWLHRDKTIKIVAGVWALSILITTCAITADELTGYVVFRYILACEVLPTNVLLVVAYPLMYLTIRRNKVCVTTTKNLAENVSHQMPKMDNICGSSIPIPQPHSFTSNEVFQIPTSDETSAYTAIESIRGLKSNERVSSFAKSTKSLTYADKVKKVKSGRKSESRLLVFGAFISFAFSFCLLPATTCYLIYGSPLKGGQNCFDISFTLRSLNCILNPIIYLLHQYCTPIWEYTKRSLCICL